MTSSLRTSFTNSHRHFAGITRHALRLSAILLVLASNNLFAQDLISSAPDAPQYRLSNPRFESDRFDRQNFVVDYTRTKEGKLDPTPTVLAGGKTKSGALNVIGASIFKTEGELRLSNRFGSMNDIEIYFVIQGAYGKMLVSNIARKGNPGSKTRARKWTDKEKKAYERSKLSKTPPKNLPDGYIAVSSGAKLLPGMPIKAGSYAEWVDATVIRAEKNNQVLVQIDSNRGLTTLNRSKWLAIKSDTLKEGADNPEQFSTDIQVLPGSRLALPDATQPLPEDLDLPVGTPLKYDYRIQWRDVYVLNSDDGKIKFRYKGYGATWDETKPRDKFLVSDDILKQLNEPGAAEKFASNIETEKFPTSGSDGFPKRKPRVKSYPIKLELPADSQIVPNDLILPPGTPLAACWARKWHAISVLSANDDGTVNIRFDRHRTEYTMARNELIVQNKTLKKLKRKTTETDKEQSVRYTAKELKKTLRVWTDVTGKFKTEAFYVSHNETKVTLKTAADREINMPLKKLGTADRELLSSIVEESENPFK